ncbi:MAG: MerR family transcriptional regulator [Clostridiaceae bacterium]|nr:MerR family transcriptional regulator [Clostridiaceae bacterium]
MALMTIRQVSTSFDVSARTLRYYEEIGLLWSIRPDDYAYRVYDEVAVERLRQILLLRRLRIPLKQIRDLLTRQEIGPVIELLQRRLSDIEAEARDLAGLRDILAVLIHHLRAYAARLRMQSKPEDGALLELFRAIATMDDTGDKANEEVPLMTPGKLTDVRIITLPPATVAVSHYIGDNPEGHASEPLDRFVTSERLWEQKPDLRHFGFNHPNPSEDNPVYGYEMWVTIPDDLEVPAPLEKKHFPGGLYAAHKIEFPNFGEWNDLMAWAHANPDYEPGLADDNGEQMYGLLEEHLNYVLRVQEGTGEDNMQLDLLFPVKRRK